MFHLIPGASVITNQKGIFRQADAYHYKGRVFIKHGTGYAWIVKSLGNLETSVPNMRVEELNLGFEPTFNLRGYLTMPEGK